jgi:hypothetical protein
MRAVGDQSAVAGWIWKDPKDPAKPRAGVCEWPEGVSRDHFAVREISAGVEPLRSLASVDRDDGPW